MRFFWQKQIDKATVFKYIDRFLMYYIRTAGPLVRTSTWLEKLEGGLDYLKEVIIHDSIGICETLRSRNGNTWLDTFECEWKQVIEKPEINETF